MLGDIDPDDPFVVTIRRIVADMDDLPRALSFGEIGTYCGLKNFLAMVDHAASQREMMELGHA